MMLMINNLINMATLSIELIKSEYKKWQPKSKSGFGAYMNTAYNLNDIDLLKEIDTNMAMLRLLKDHVQEENYK
jgi:hypothetical protein